jgi:predicted nucleic acid-binding protein
LSTIFDSNILIYHLNGQLDERVDLILKKCLNEEPYISVVTRIEILGWPELSQANFERAERLLDLFNEQPLTADIVSCCIDLRRHKRIKVPDAIIEATALCLRIPLITNNIDDFKGIDSLNLIDPFAA